MQTEVLKQLQTYHTDQNLILKLALLGEGLTSKICHAIMEKKLGENWQLKVFKNYFDDQEHPIIKAWKEASFIIDADKILEKK